MFAGRITEMFMKGVSLASMLGIRKIWVRIVLSAEYYYWNRKGLWKKLMKVGRENLVNTIPRAVSVQLFQNITARFWVQCSCFTAFDYCAV